MTRCLKTRTSRGPYAGRISHGHITRKLVKLLDGGNANLLPLFRLECGHEVRTQGIRFARCPQCSGERRQDARV